MRRLAFLAAAGLGALRERLVAESGADRNPRWAVSMFLWTSTPWKNDGSARFTDMLDVIDVIKDTGFDGFRLTGWPPDGAVEKAGTHNAPFMLSNQDLGDGVLDFPALHRVLNEEQVQGMDRH